MSIKNTLEVHSGRRIKILDILRDWAMHLKVVRKKNVKMLVLLVAKKNRSLGKRRRKIPRLISNSEIKTVIRTKVNKNSRKGEAKAGVAVLIRMSIFGTTITWMRMTTANQHQPRTPPIRKEGLLARRGTGKTKELNKGVN